MSKAWTDVKSFVTITFTLTLVALLFVTAFRLQNMFETVFLLFTNVCTAVFTYFFTRKKDKDKDINKEG